MIYIYEFNSDCKYILNLKPLQGNLTSVNNYLISNSKNNQNISSIFESSSLNNSLKITLDIKEKQSNYFFVINFDLNAKELFMFEIECSSILKQKLPLMIKVLIIFFIFIALVIIAIICIRRKIRKSRIHDLACPTFPHGLLQNEDEYETTQKDKNINTLDKEIDADDAAPPNAENIENDSFAKPCENIPNRELDP